MDRQNNHELLEPERKKLEKLRSLGAKVRAEQEKIRKLNGQKSNLEGLVKTKDDLCTVEGLRAGELEELVNLAKQDLQRQWTKTREKKDLIQELELKISKMKEELAVQTDVMKPSPQQVNGEERILTRKQKQLQKNNEKIKQKYVVNPGPEYAQRYNRILRDIQDTKMELRRMDITTTRLQGEVAAASLAIKEKDAAIAEEREKKELSREKLKALRTEISSHQQLHKIQDARILELMTKLSEYEIRLRKE